MRINSISNQNFGRKQNFGNLHVATNEQRREILNNLDGEYKNKLDNIRWNHSQSITVTKNDDVFYWELDLGLHKPQKVEAINADLTTKVKKAIDYFYPDSDY